MRKAEEIVAHLPKGQMITTHQKIERLIEQAQREAIEEAATKIGHHFGPGAAATIRALLPHKE